MNFSRVFLSAGYSRQAFRAVLRSKNGTYIHLLRSCLKILSVSFLWYGHGTALTNIWRIVLCHIQGRKLILLGSSHSPKSFIRSAIKNPEIIISVIVKYEKFLWPLISDAELLIPGDIEVERLEKKNVQVCVTEVDPRDKVEEWWHRQTRLQQARRHRSELANTPAVMRLLVLSMSGELQVREESHSHRSLQPWGYGISANY